MSTELLIELVRRYSPSTQEADAVQYLVGWMQAQGFEAYKDAVGNAVGFKGAADADHTLILLGHIDTVTGEIPVRIEAGTLYGRGTVDAKGSLATFAQATALANVPNNWRVIVVGAVEEEIATSRGAYHIREQFNPDLCIIGEPSAANRITLGYKGRLLVEFNLSRPLVHTARDEPSIAAVAAEFWQQILVWTIVQNGESKGHFEQISPHLRSINTTSDGFCDSVQMTIGFRLPPRTNPTALFETIRDFAPPDAHLLARGQEQAYLGQKNNVLVRGLLATIRSQGRQPAFVVKTGTSDMNVVGVKWACPIVAYGPGDSNLDHTPHEHLPLDEYLSAVATLKTFIENLPNAESPPS